MFGSLAITGGQVDAFDFHLSKGTFSANAILDSAMSPPGRYVLEVGRRTVRARPDCDAVVISNPILPMTGAVLADLVLTGGNLPVPAVICDEADFPIAYALPRALFENGRDRFLNLLSATKRMVDSRLLAHLTGQTVTRPNTALESVMLPNSTVMNSPQGFIFNENPKVWGVQCANAVALMERRPDWEKLPLAAHHPGFAGDVLFFSMASQMSPCLDFGAQVICSAYQDIFEECGNRLDPIVLDMLPAHRDGRVSDADYFIDSLPRLPQAVHDNHFLVFSRASKYYALTPFSLFDHARFALGESLTSFEETWYFRAPPVSSRCLRPVSPLRVLLQLNGGWPLKTYPKADRRVLVRALRALGCEVTVLDLEDVARDGARVEQAGSTQRLRALLDDHHVFVSVDSFPLHYASQIVGHPTVALFGVTAPSNSDAPRGRGYRLPQPMLPCGGCGTYRHCPLTGQEYCSNYPSPDAIVASVFEVAAEMYGADAAEQVA